MCQLCNDARYIMDTLKSSKALGVGAINPAGAKNSGIPNDEGLSSTK